MSNEYPIRSRKENSSNSLYSDGSLALGLLIGVVISILVYLGLQYWSSETVDEAHEVLAIIPIILSLILPAT